MSNIMDGIVADDETSLKMVMKMLVELVSSSLSYLLKAEIERSRQQANYQQLSDRLDAALAPMEKAPTATVDLLSSRRAVKTTTHAQPTIHQSEVAKASDRSSDVTLSPGGNATDWLFAYTTAHAQPAASASSANAAAEVRGTPSQRYSTSSTAVTPQVHITAPLRSTNSATILGHRYDNNKNDQASNIKSTPSSPEKYLVSLPADVEVSGMDEDTLSLYQYLATDRSYLSSNLEQTPLPHTSTSIYGAKASTGTGMTSNASVLSSAYTDHAFDSNPWTRSRSLPSQPKKAESAYHSTDVKMQAFDNLVKRLTFQSPGNTGASSSQPLAEQETVSMVQARRYVPSPAVAPKHPYY
jgi:hypothetical protein